MTLFCRAALVRGLCEAEDIPLQEYMCRRDMRCGTTVGPIIACAAYWRLGSEYPYYGAAALVLLPLLLALGLPPVPGRAAPEPADSGEAATGSPEAPAEEPAPEDTDAS